MISALPDSARVVQIDAENCDAVVVNTCAVTSRAEADGRKLIRRAKRRHPSAAVIVTGCAAQVNPQAWANMPEVDRVIGISERERLADFLETTAAASGKIAVSSPEGGVRGPTPLSGHRSRAFLKIQDGCSRGCTYCIVPRARGAERSRPAEQIKEDVIRLAAEGFREVVLTGVHLGRWGCDLEGSSGRSRSSFDDLLETLDEIDANARLRLSSIEPMDLTPDLVRRILGHRLICPHLHMPLQSAHTGILRAMGRNYTAERYDELLSAAKETHPDAALGTDIMIGFPGEDDRAFQESLDFITERPFTYVHLFTYSPRPSTPAASLPGRPAGREIRSRLRLLRDVDKAKRQAFLTAMDGQVRPCLVEWPSHRSGRLTALSDNYIRVILTSSEYNDRPGQLASLIIDTKGIKEHGMPVGIPVGA